MKRTIFISAAALMLASTFSLTNAVSAHAYGWDDRTSYDDDAGPYSERSRHHGRSREDWRDIMLDQLQNRQGLRDRSEDRWSGREGGSNPMAEGSGGSNCMGRRADYRDLGLGRHGGRNGSHDFMGDRDRNRDDLQDWILDRMERRALLREMLADHMQREDDWGGRASSRFEGAEENDGGSAITRADLRDLILARIRSNGQVDQVLEQIQERIEGEE